MGYWEYNAYDCICSNFLKAQANKKIYLYVGAINTPPSNPNQYVVIETLHFASNADVIRVFTLDYGDKWPSQPYDKHQVIYCFNWAQPWSYEGRKQAGVNTEIVRSTYMNVGEELPFSSVKMCFAPTTNLLDFNCLLSPGQVLVFVPDSANSYLHFTFKLYKFPVPLKKELENKKKVFIAN